MQLGSASIFVRRGMAYLPVMALTDTGLRMGVEPIYAVTIASTALVDALQNVLAAGHPRIPHPTQDEWPRISRESPVLKAAGVKGWKEFSRDSAVYNVDWTERGVTVYISQLDKQGRAEFAQARKMSFAPDSPVQSIAEAIVEDILSRPELLEPRSR